MRRGSFPSPLLRRALPLLDRAAERVVERQAKGETSNITHLVCPFCQGLVEPAHWASHRASMCAGPTERTPA